MCTPENPEMHHHVVGFMMRIILKMKEVIPKHLLQPIFNLLYADKKLTCGSYILLCFDVNIRAIFNK